MVAGRRLPPTAPLNPLDPQHMIHIGLYPTSPGEIVNDDPKALLDAYWKRPDRNEWTDAEAFDILDDALRAVLDLHAKHPGADWCMHCLDENGTLWPCPTIRKIVDVLKARQPEPPKPPPPPNPCYWSGSVRVHVRPGCRCGKFGSGRWWSW